jgi:hypothetical protein
LLPYSRFFSEAAQLLYQFSSFWAIHIAYYVLDFYHIIFSILKSFC